MMGLVNADCFTKDRVKDIFFGSVQTEAAVLAGDLLASGNVAKVTMAALIAEQAAKKSGLPRKNLVILSTFTLQTIEPFIRLCAFANGYDVSFQWVEYDRWWQVLSEGGDNLQANPDLLIWIAHPEDIVANLGHAQFLPNSPDLEANIEQGLGLLRSAVEMFRDKSSTALAISTLPETWGPRPPYRGGPGLSRVQILNSLNGQITEIANTVANTFVFDYAAVVSDFGRLRWFDPLKDHQYRAALSVEALPFLSNELWRFAVSMQRARKKVLALDLDNTLWGGIVGECGPKGVAVRGDFPGNAYREFQQFVKNMKETGIALVLVSRNNERDVREAFELNDDMPLSWDDFAAYRVNWENKADNLVDIARELNLGVDSFVFVDDSPVECELVRKMLPEVTVVHLDGPPSFSPELILKTRAFDTVTVTYDDRIRTKSYTSERQRKEFRVGQGTFESFLNGLELELTIGRPEDDELERVTQLFAKTNQFNMTTTRHSLSDVIAIQKQEDAWLVVAKLSDRFGDYGTISVIELRRKSPLILSIDSFLISCRALGRNVEMAIVAWIENQARTKNFAELHGRRIKTQKNGLTETFYSKFGFKDAGDGIYIRNLAEDSLSMPTYIRVSSLDNHNQ